MQRNSGTAFLYIIFFSLTFAGVIMGDAARAEVCLVKDGKPAATIVVARRTVRSVKLSVRELNYHLKLVTGTELPVATDEESVNGQLVLVGASKLTKKLGLDNDDFEKQEYCIENRGPCLVIMGHDGEECGKIDYEGTGLWAGWKNDGWYLKPIGTVYAVHDFLRRYCGVRWYMPGEWGTFCPKRETITVSDINLRRKPWLEYRDPAPWNYVIPKNLCCEIGKPIKDEKGNYSFDLMSQREVNLYWLRHKAGGRGFTCNHSLAHWPRKYGKSHPEYFAVDKDGKRDLSESDRNASSQLCYSSEAVVKQVAEEFREHVRQVKNGKLNRYDRNNYFPVVPMDQRKWCQCENCQKYFSARTIDDWKKHFSNDSASNYLWSFINNCAKEALKIDPTKTITALAYADYYVPPSDPDFALSPNVAVMICKTNTRIFAPLFSENGYSKEDLKHWRQITPNLYFWEYYCFPQFRKYNVFPALVPHKIAEMLRLQHEMGVKGIFWEDDTMPRVLGFMGQDHLDWYITMRLADDIEQDVDILLADYYRNFYGPAAGPMSRFFTAIEAVNMSYGDFPERKRDDQHIDAEFSWKKLCPPKKVKVLRRIMDEAIELAKENPWRARVEIIDNTVMKFIEHYSRVTNGITAYVPKVKCARCEKAPDLRKGPDDIVWKKAQKTKGFFNSSNDRMADETTARVLYSGKFMYVLIECMQKESITANKRERDRVEIGFDDSVEFFVDADNGSEYRQFLINAAGSFYDGKAKDASWNGEAIVETGKTKDGWWVALAVPLEPLNDIPPVPDGNFPPRKGKKWRVNFCRNRVLHDGTPDEHSSWAPMHGQFHQKDLFGILEFE